MRDGVIVYPVRAHLSAIAPIAFLLGCGGQTSHGGPADAGADRTGAVDSAAVDAPALDGSVADAADASMGCGFSCDAGAPTACPATPPQAGTPCNAPQICEYGTSWFLTCNLVLRCQSTTGTGPGTWLEESDGGGCPWLDAGGPCPATYAQAEAVDAAPGSCPFVSCVYPEGFCGCGVMCGGGGGVPRPHDVTGFFACIPSAPGCPEPRPLSGTACDAGLSCNYGFACGCGQIQQCTSAGSWSAEPGPACP